jgi:hypothetical protein
MSFKTPKIRNKKHLAYIRSLDCIITANGEHCNGSPIHAHHLTILKNQRGIGQKVGDNFTLPLCSLHHDTLHRMGEKRFWQMWGIIAELEAARLWEKNNFYG